MNIPNYPPSSKYERQPDSRRPRLSGTFLAGEIADREAGTWWARAGWLGPAVLMLAVLLSFGLGFLAGRDAGRQTGPEDRLWIEQLPPEVRGVAGTTTSAVVPAPRSPTRAAGETPTVSSQSAAVGTLPSPATGAFVASRSGTKYYLPWCATAQRIKEENKVWFSTREEAAAAGYEPASNCKGL